MNNTKELLARVNLKYTKQREIILDALRDLKVPVTVEKLDDYCRQHQHPINLSTIYRTIDSLSQVNLIHKTYNSITQTTMIELVAPTHKHYLVCVECHKMIPIKMCPMHSILDSIESDYDFVVASHQLEISGLCSACAKKKSLVTEK
ncbi:MAG: transcriptional repressor [Erysipelothrix sp.]|jgi:Fur family ferric uptake transcriptional regulator|nr:transcriptional repressor [Erysipelothrix sp.]